MIRWLLVPCLVVCLCACGNNGNGLPEVKNAGDADQDKEIDVHASQPGVWHCVSIAISSRTEAPCFETLAKCEATRATALGNGYDVGKCERYSFAICFQSKKPDFSGWDCRRTQADCDQQRKRMLTTGYEVTECMRVPPESWQGDDNEKSSH